MIFSGSKWAGGVRTRPAMILTTLTLATLTLLHLVTLLQSYNNELLLPQYNVSLHKNNEAFFNAPAPIGLQTDELALQFSTITSMIGLAASIYASFYMGDEPEYVRFSTLLHFFTFSIFLFFKASTLVTMVLGWELMGIFSYFLITF